MRPWNPHSQTFQGDAITGAVPTGFIVYGPAMSPRTGAMAQAAFASFCARSLLSVVPNPTEHGQLPDGSPFQITVIAGVPKMKVWTSRADEEAPRRSGIGLILTDLNGAPISGHLQADGSPQAYILTPGIKRGTRDSDGKWRVRKVPDFVGGKAAFCDRSGRRYLLGVSGARMDRLPVSGFGFYGTNQRAYRYGEVGGGSPVISNDQRPVGTFRDDRAILPFFRRHSNGELWAMQILTIFGPGGNPPHRFELYGSRYVPDPSGPLGEFITTITIPVGYAPVWQSMSIHPDGTQMRMMFEPRSFVTATIGDSSISITSIVAQGSSDPPYTTVEVIGEGTSDVTRIQRGSNGSSWIGGHFGFSAKGAPTNMEVMGGSEEYESIAREVTVYSEGDGPWTTTTTDDTRYDYRAAKILYDGIVSAPPDSVGTYNSEIVIVRARGPTGLIEYFDASGFFGSSDWVEETGLVGADIIYDATSRTRVRFYRNTRRVSSGHYITVGDGSSGNPWNTGGVVDSVTYSTEARLVVERNGVRAFDLDIADRENTTYTAIAATDPVTGAICINVLERQSFTLVVLRSWIFVVDDISVKRLHDIMDVADSTSIMIRSDKDLLSV